ncbi:MAG: hypothetical protein ACRBN8_12920 [Nannocystales bacterium]
MREYAYLLGLSLLAACAASPSPKRDGVPGAPATESMLRAEYRGVVDLEAHLANPGDTVPLELGWAQTCDASGVCLVEQSAGEGAEADRIWSTPEATWAEGESHRFSAEEANHHRRLLRLFANPDGKAETSVEFTHPRLGMTIDSAAYDEFSPEGVATAIEIDFHDGSVAWRGSLVLEGATPVESLAVPDAPPAKTGLEPSIAKLREGLWDVRLPSLDARSFVIEFESFVVTVEAPWSSAAGEQAVDLITETFPGKPIRYALYSHHHPHASGGLRAFMAAGATVVAPTAHEAYLDEVTGRDFTLEPDRLSKTNAKPSSIAFEETFTIAEAGQSLQVIDIGEQSRHTTHYMMFWLSDANVLIQGDLGWFVAPDGAVRVGSRSAGLLEAIDTRELPVETLLQGWPVNSQEPSLSMEEFRAALSSGGE